MKILFLSTWFPYPLDTGSRIRVYYLLRSLARVHQVHLITFMPDARAKVFLSTLADWGIATDVVARDPFWRDPNKKWRSYFSVLPRDTVTGYSWEMAALTQGAVRERQYDAAVAFQINTAPYLLAAPGLTRVFDVDNYMTRWMEEEFKGQRAAAKKLLRWVTWQKCRRHEHALFRVFDACTFASERDCHIVAASMPEHRGRVEVIPNGVDLDRNSPGLIEAKPDTLVFNGALTYYANADAMHFFCSEILPAIQALRPGLQLRITGRHDGVDLTGIAGVDGVTLTGFLEDVRPAVAGAWACVVPLRHGGGTRLKILEAMALGTPVVATSKGAEGLDVTHERDILIADEPADFARQTNRLLGDPELRTRLAVAGRALVEAKYGWDRIGELFCSLVEGLVNRSTDRRTLGRYGTKTAWNGTPR